MDEINKILITLFFCFGGFFVLSPVFAQEDEGTLTTYEIAEMNYEKAMTLYREGEYDRSLELVNIYIREFEEKKIRYPKKVRADIYVLRGMLSYAFREEGYREEIVSLFRKAVKTHLDIEIGDATQVPPFLIELFKNTKAEYLDKYSKRTRRHTIGLVTTLICTEAFEPKNFQPGIHYGFNINNSVSIDADIKLGIGSYFWNTWHFKVGGIVYSDFRVEKIVYGLGFYNILSINYNEESIKNSISLRGHGEFITRPGLGIAADIEVMRLDIDIKSEDKTDESSKIAPIGKHGIQFFFASFDLYMLITF